MQPILCRIVWSMRRFLTSNLTSKVNIKGKRNKIITSNALLYRVSIQGHGDNNTITIMPGARVSNTDIRLYGSGHTLVIGPVCIIKRGMLWLEDNGCTIEIRHNTTAEDISISAAENGRAVRVGADCMFSSQVHITTTDSHSVLDAGTKQRINPAGDVIIGDHVWVGAGVRILKGVRVGDNSVIGAGSIVTKDIPCNTVVAGIPARVIKEGVTWERERK